MIIDSSVTEYERFESTPEKVDWGRKLLQRYAEREEPIDDFVVLEAETSFIVPLGEKHSLVGRSDLFVLPFCSSIPP